MQVPDHDELCIVLPHPRGEVERWHHIKDGAEVCAVPYPGDCQCPAEPTS
jgi:hypothetical protein